MLNRLLKMPLSTLSLSVRTAHVPRQKLAKAFSVSGIFRIKNARATIELAVRSVLPLLDEIVIVDNDSTDGTPDIIKRLQEELHETVIIRLLHWPFALARAGRGYRAQLRDRPEGSISRFYQYTFSQGTSDYLMKCDAHYIFTPRGLDDIAAKINHGHDVVTYPGVDMFGNHHPFERFIFKKELGWKFLDGAQWELLKFEHKVNIGRVVNPCFVHVKRYTYVKYLWGSRGVAGLYA